jgi:transcriptional regulator with XRE-family HTH domain
VAWKTPQTTNELAQRMHRALIAAGLTQVEAANRAGVPRDIVHKAVNRGSVPRSVDAREAVAKALGVTPEWLWYGRTFSGPVDAPAPPPPPPVQAAPGSAAAAAAPVPADAHVEMFEGNDGEPFVSAGHGLLVSPSVKPRLGDLMWVRMEGYDGPARYAGTLGNELVLEMAGGVKRRVPRSEVTEILGVLGTVRGVVIR